MDEEIPHARENGRQHQRNRDGRKGLHRRSAETAARLFNGRIDLRKRCNHVADARRGITEEISRHQDVDGAREHDRLVVESNDVRNADHRTGQRVIEERHRLQNSAAAHFKPRRGVAHQYSEQTAQRRADAGNQQRIFNRLAAVREDVAVIFERDLVIDAPDLHQRTREDDGVEIKNEGNHHGNRRDDPRGKKRSGAFHAASAAGLARNCHVTLLADPPALQ